MGLEALGFWDYIVFFAVLLMTFGAVVLGRFRAKTKSSTFQITEYLLMGRRLSLPLFIFTLVASWYGGIFGVTQIAFESGIYNFITQGVFWYVAYIVFALFLIQPLRQYSAMTLPGLLGEMFGPQSARIGAVFNFFNVLPIAYAISVGLFLKTLFGGDLFYWTAVGVAFATAYSIVGGFRSVVISDALQFFVMCSSVLLIAVTSVVTFGGADFLAASLPPTHFEIFGKHGVLTTFVWGFIALSTLVDPNFYQRIFAARSTKTARRGIFIATGVWVAFDICTTIGAMYARAVMPEAEAGTAYLTYALGLLPEGLRGFVLAGILATILSTIDSYLLIAGTTLSVDLSPKRLWQKAWFQHAGVIFVGALAVLLAQVFEGNIREVWKTLGSYSAASLLIPVLVGYFRPQFLTDRGFVSSCLMAALAVTLWRHFEPWSAVDELYAGLLVSFLSVLALRKKRRGNGLRV